MHRCYKFIVSLLVLTCVLVPVRKVFATESDSENNKGISAIQTKYATQQKEKL